jgi:hypothetical protein
VDTAVGEMAGFCDRFARDGRRIAPRASTATHRDARGTQVAADGLAPHARGLLDAAY